MILFFAVPFQGVARPDQTPTTDDYDFFPHDEAVFTIGSALDNAQYYVDEYGTISLSTPILNSAKSGEFLFALSNGAAFYFNDAKTNVQGRAAVSDQSFNTFQANLQAQWDPTVATSFGFAAQNAFRQQEAYQLQQQAVQQSAKLNLEAALAQAATNTSLSASNQAVASAYAAYATNVYGAGGPPAFPLASTYNTNIAPMPNLALSSAVNSTNIAQQMAMVGFLGLLNNSAQAGLTLDDGTAVLLAAANQQMENMFRAMGNPNQFGDFVNSEMYFGVSTVSVDPGWRTRNGNWSGKIAVTARLEFKDARHETVTRILDDPKWPVELRARIAKDYGYPWNNGKALRDIGISRGDEIAGVAPDKLTDPELEDIPYSFRCKTLYKPIQVVVLSPMIAAQTLDLASSYRAESEFSLMISAALNYAGATGAGKMFEDNVQTLQKDFATRTTMNTVNGFSGQDGSFGFDIGPSAQALADPTSIDSSSGNVLQRQTFPALLIMSMSRGDIEPRLIVTNDATLNNVVSASRRFVRVYEPYIALSQTHNWMPSKSPTIWHEPLAESRAVRAVDSLEYVKASIAKLVWQTKTDISGYSGLTDVLRERIHRYEDALLGTINYVSLPQDHMVPDVAAEDPVVTNTIPASISLRYNPDGSLDTAPVNFVLQGANMDAVDTNSITGLFANISNVVVLAQTLSTLVVQASITNGDFPVIFKMSSTVPGSRAQILSQPVVLQSQARLPVVSEIFPKSVTLKAGSGGSAVSNSVAVVMVGSDLSRLDTNNLTLMADGCAVLVQSNLLNLGYGLKTMVGVTNTGIIAFKLQVPNWPHLGDTNYILSPAIKVDLGSTNGGSDSKTGTNPPSATASLVPVASWTYSAMPGTSASTNPVVPTNKPAGTPTP